MTATAPMETARLHRRVFVLLVILMASRAVFMITSPLVDSSEARHAEISRKMVETGDWITPQFDYGVPYWANPPLSIWMSALGIDLFGADEFGSRIFIFLSAAGVLALVARSVARETDAVTGIASATVLMTMPLFYYCSAAVMTDLPFLMGITLSMVSFRAAMTGGSRGWGYGFFLGVAAGVMAEGPVTLLLVIPPVLIWSGLAGRWRQVGSSLPWITGSLLMLALALPWYFLAESKTPGFSHYFLLGENWRQFTVKGWKGDLYGHSHPEPAGVIWLFWLIATFPACLALAALPFHRWREARSLAMANDARGLHLMLWALWPLIFYTPSRNIISTYPLAALPASAMLIAGIPALRRTSEKPLSSRLPALSPAMILLAAGTLLTAGIVGSILPEIVPQHTERDLVGIYKGERKRDDRLLYYGTRRYSAEFYSEGEVASTGSLALLTEKMEGPGRLFIAMMPATFHALPPGLQRRILPLTHWQNHRINLYRERTDTPRMSGIDPFQTDPIGS